MKKFMIVMIVLLTMLIGGCASEQETTTLPVETPPAPQTLPPETTVPETVPREAITVEAPCGTLYIPDDWDIPIHVTMTLGEPMVLTFWADDVMLYDLSFWEDAQKAIGAVQTDDGPVNVGLKIYTLPETSNTLMAMQESVNAIIDQMDLTEVVLSDAKPAESLLLETDYGILKFPGKWEKYLVTEFVDGYALEFYCCLPEHDPVLVFTVLFQSEDGEIITSMMDEEGNQTVLSIWIAQMEFDDSWSDTEIDMAYAMQEDMNYLLDALGYDEDMEGMI